MIPIPHAFRLPAAAVATFALTSAVGALAAPNLPDAAAFRTVTHGTAWVHSWHSGDPVVGPAAVSSHFPGLWVTLDPATRRPVTPSPEQRQAAQAALLRAPEVDAPLPVERIKGGGELVHLNGRHVVFSVARRDASGRFTTSCVHDSLEAARILAGPPPAARGRVER